MDKYEFNIKVEQIKKLANKSDYATAMKIADTVDWRRVRNVTLLTTVALVYEKNEEYQEAKDILLLAFERAPVGKRLLYKLTELSVKEGKLTEAETYYREFCDTASDDPRQNLLRYMILKEKGAPAEQLIHSLESYTSEELDERWMYELADLYRLAGREEDCVRMCDKIMLMFGLGHYVDKAMELKLQYAPLTQYQMDLVENRDKYEARLRALEEETAGPSRSEPEEEPEEDYEDDENSVEAEESAVPEAEGFDDSPQPADLAARLQEAEVEEQLAQEMSRISIEDEPQEESELEKTRVFTDLKSLRTNTDAVVRAMPAMAAMLRKAAASEAALRQSASAFEEAVKRCTSGLENAQEDPQGEIPDAVNEMTVSMEVSPELREAQAAAYDEGVSMPEEIGKETGMPMVSDMSISSEEMPVEDYGCSSEDYDAYEPGFGAFIEYVGKPKPANPKPAKKPVGVHLMIKAADPVKGLETAKGALKQLHKGQGIQNQAAKITGERLNKRGITASITKIAGKDLIVEHAFDLSAPVLQELEELIRSDRSGMVVVLIDAPEKMEQLKEQNPELAGMFKWVKSKERTEEASETRDEYVPVAKQEEEMPPARSRKAAVRTDTHSSAHTPVKKAPAREFLEEDEIEGDLGTPKTSPVKPVDQMEPEEFAQYAVKYAGDIDCSITGKSMLALYERIEIMEEDGVPLTMENAEALIEEAADMAEKPPLLKRMKGLFSPRYDGDGLLILKEEHFI